MKLKKQDEDIFNLVRARHRVDLFMLVLQLNLLTIEEQTKFLSMDFEKAINWIVPKIVEAGVTIEQLAKLLIRRHTTKEQGKS